MKTNSKTKDLVSCTCEKCAAECERRPGWFTPGEALKAIKAGYAERLVEVVDMAAVPAVAPRGDGTLGFIGRCVFLTADRRCEIHDSGFKPVECRLGYGCQLERGLPPEVMYSMWRTRLGKQAVQALREAQCARSP